MSHDIDYLWYSSHSGSLVSTKHRPPPLVSTMSDDEVGAGILWTQTSAMSRTQLNTPHHTPLQIKG